MKIGIIGYRSSGKTTLFEALCGQQSKYGFSEKQMIRNIKVPDTRVDLLYSIFKPKKKSYTNIDFIDFQGIDNDNDRAGFNISSLNMQKLKDLDGLLILIDGYSGSKDIEGDRKTIEGELSLNDMVLTEQRLNALKKANNIHGEFPVLERIYNSLYNGVRIRDIDLSEAELDLIHHYRFLTQKPVLFVANVGDETLTAKTEDDMFYINALIEKEITELPEEDQLQFLQDLGYDASLKTRIIREVYQLLDLISFLTVGPNEVRAWELRRGSTALKAAGKVHSDIARGFIRAEVISYSDFSELKSLPLARKNGKMRSEGKEYIVRDGDIIEFKFNV